MNVGNGLGPGGVAVIIKTDFCLTDYLDTFRLSLSFFVSRYILKLDRLRYFKGRE